MIFITFIGSLGKISSTLVSVEDVSKVPTKNENRSVSLKEQKQQQNVLVKSSQRASREGADSESDFESDPPSPKSSEDDDPEDEETIHGDQGIFHEDNDPEPEIIGQRPLLMDSDEEEEEKHSSDSDYDRTKSKNYNVKIDRPVCAAEGQPRENTTKVLRIDNVKQSTNPQLDAFGAIPFYCFNTQKDPEEQGVKEAAPITMAKKGKDEFDVFSQAPFNRKSDAPDCPITSPCNVDIFGCSPFYPLPTQEGKMSSGEDIFGLVPFEEIAGQQNQQKVKQQRNLQKISSRQRRTKPEPANNNGKRHHGTPSSAKKTAKPSYRTPEKVRRHKKGGRRDSQSSNEFLTISDSKENISISINDVKDRNNILQADESMVDPFGAKPFHPQDLRQPQHHGLGDNRGDHPAATGRPRQSSLHGGYLGSDNAKMDDFGAVPFTELVLQSVTQPQSQQPPSQPLDLDPFGAAPFPSKP